MRKLDTVGKGIINNLLKGNSRISDDEQNEGLDVIIKMDCEGGEIEKLTIF